MSVSTCAVVQKEKEALEARIEATRSHVDAQGIRYKTLRYERNTLLTRIKTAKSEQAAPHPAWQRHQDKTARTPPALPHGGQQVIVSDDTPGSRRGIASMSILPTRIGRQQFVDDYDEVPIPISSFRHHVSISFADIAPFMPPSQMWYKDHDNALSAATTAYLQSVGADLGRHKSEICWFNQLPYDLAEGRKLSHSAGAMSPECCLSLSLAFPVISAESLFLVLEHEMLEAATNPDFAPSAHPELDAMQAEHELPLGDATFDVEPERPSKRDLAALKVR